MSETSTLNVEPDSKLNASAICTICGLIAQLFQLRKEFEAIEGIDTSDVSTFENAIGEGISSCSNMIVAQIERSVRRG